MRTYLARFSRSPRPTRSGVSSVVDLVEYWLHMVLARHVLVSMLYSANASSTDLIRPIKGIPSSPSVSPEISVPRVLLCNVTQKCFQEAKKK